MAVKKQRTELLVGGFILFGLILFGLLAFQFGQFGAGKRTTYPLTVKVRDASGIRAGAPVRIGGLDIGAVSSDPKLDDEFRLVSIGIRVDQGTRIPRGAKVNIGTSGLMGDRFIRIIPPQEVDGEYFAPNDEIAASSAATIDDVATGAVQTLGQAERTLSEIGDSVRQLNEIFARFESGVLDQENVDNLKLTMENMKHASVRLEEVSHRFGPFLDKADQAIESVQGTAEDASSAFAEVNEVAGHFSTTLETINPVLVEFDDALVQLRGTMQTMDGLLNDFESGDGVAEALLNDEELRQDLSDFMDKLEKNGILFYPRERHFFRLRKEKSDQPELGPRKSNGLKR